MGRKTSVTDGIFSAAPIDKRTRPPEIPGKSAIIPQNHRSLLFLNRGKRGRTTKPGLYFHTDHGQGLKPRSAKPLVPDPPRQSQIASLLRGRTPPLG